jgi:phosphoglycerate dehydrogenase-like enzyme
MRSVITVHPDFDFVWPFAADHLHALWQAQGPVEFIRQTAEDRRPLSQVIHEPASVTRLASLGTWVTADCAFALSGLEEVALEGFDLWEWHTDPQRMATAVPPPVEERYNSAPLIAALVARGVRHYVQTSEGFWGQSVAEFALALTLCGLRRIPQTHRQIISDLSPWIYEPADGVGRPGGRGFQFGDDPRFTHGTLAGKRVRIVGAGNIGSRFASFAKFLGADVASWDPYAPEPCFHRAGSRREWHLSRLVQDAEIFAPMVPMTDKTRGLIDAAMIDSLPRGCLLVLVTRAAICDMAAVRRRVLADEIALASDVFDDLEPLPLGDPLLGRHNVVHTPHNAGRTRQANEEWAQMLAAQFLPPRSAR